MTRKCELCRTLKTHYSAAEQKPAPGRLRRVLIEDRVIALCEAHAVKVRARAPESLAQLRALFHEQRGQRSLLERRAPADRRAFPARPEGRRASTGRRASDPRD